MFTTRLFFRWQKMLFKMKVLYCPKLPQRPKFPHLTVLCLVVTKYHVCKRIMGLKILYGFCGPAKYTAAMHAPQ